MLLYFYDQQHSNFNSSVLIKICSAFNQYNNIKKLSTLSLTKDKLKLTDMHWRIYCEVHFLFIYFSDILEKIKINGSR